MGDCEESIRQLYEFLDGELTPERRTSIRTHLDDCSHCLDAFGFETELRVIVSQHCRERVPEELKDRIARMIAGLADAGSAG